MKYVGKAIGTIAIWAGVAGLSYLFHSFGMLTSAGAAWLTIGAFLLTAGVWNLN